MKEYPSGVVARVEDSWSQREFVEKVKPEYAMMKITHARRLMKRGETFEEYFGHDETDVITTTTVPDNKLNLLRWEDELEIVQETQPDFHIPTDYSIYSDMDEAEQLNAVENCMAGTEWMHDRIEEEEIDVTLVPLIKGLTKQQREINYRVLDDLGYDYCAFYATQYFTTGRAVIDELVGDLERIKFEFSPELLVIGLLSPNYVRHLPTDVKAVAGQSKWRERVKPRKQSDDEMRREYGDFVSEVTEALHADPYADLDS